MKQEEGHIITEWLFRHFAGQLDAAGEVEILAWKQLNEENRLEYERVHVFYLDTQALAHVDTTDSRYHTEAAWKKVKAKNEIKETSKPNFYLRLVASIVLLIVGSFIVFNHYQIEEMTAHAVDVPIVQELSDGSTITLNKDTELKYPEKFRGKTREVQLSGEAYFEVESSEEMPFVIHVQDLQVMAVGTAFNVSAVADSDTVKVSVDEGIVRMVFADRTKQLAAGEEGVFVKNTTEIVKPLASVPVNTHNYWRTKQLNFNGTTLDDVITSLKSVYGTSIQLQNPAVGACKITVSFEDESLDNVLEVIAATLHLEVLQQNESYLLTGDGCVQ